MTQASNSPKPISILYFPKNPFIDQVIGVKRKRRKELHKRVGGKESRDFIKPRKKKSQKSTGDTEGETGGRNIYCDIKKKR